MCLDCFSRDMVHMGGQMVTDGWTASDECTVAVLQLTPDFIKNSCCRPTDGAVDSRSNMTVPAYDLDL